MTALSRIDRSTQKTARTCCAPGARVVGSLLSVFVGWATCVLGWATLLVPFSLVSSQGRIVEAIQSMVVVWSYIALVCGIGVLITWAFVFVWVYMSIPRHSRLWTASLSAPLGALAGALMVILLGMPLGMTLSALLSWQGLIFIISGAVTGFATCLHASLTVHRYRGDTP
jgi:hypothetical protein